MISVIVPVYNIEEYIRECLESILNQTYSDLQIIVVDDGSTDGSGKICDEYAQKDKRIQVVHTDNQGLVRARKEGLQYAKGQYVGFVDGDDSIQPRMYEELLGEIEKTNADFVHFGFQEIDDGHLRLHLRFENGFFELVEEKEKIDFIKTFVLREQCPGYEAMTYSIWSKLFRREIIYNAYWKVPDDLKVGEDLAAICFCILGSTRIVLCKKALYKYRVVKNSLSHRGRGISKVVERVEIYNFLKKIFRQYGYMEEMENALRLFLTLQIYGGLQEEAVSGTRVPFYQIEHIELFFENRLILYGAGRVGQDYYAQIRKYEQCNLLAWVDRDYEKIYLDYAKLMSLKDIKAFAYDILLIAVEKRELAEEIRKDLIADGISASKIKWQPPSYIYF